MSRMPPDIAARWQLTFERWKRENPKLPPPLRFEVPETIKVDISACASFGDAFINHQRFYAENRGGGRYRLILFYWLALFAGIAMILITLITPQGTTLWFPNWLLSLLLFVLSYWASRAEKRVTRKNTIVFERESGKVYIPSYEDAPHQVLDFYDQYFYIVDGRVDVNRFGALYLYLQKDTLEDGREVGGFPIRLAFVGDSEDAEEAWHFLVWYMNMETSFSEDEMDFFRFIKERKENAGYVVEDIRRVPGERVFF